MNSVTLTMDSALLLLLLLLPVAYRGVGFGGFKPPPEIPNALQNRAKLNPIVKTAKNC